MSDLTMQAGQVSGEAVLVHLSEDFRQVVERIQVELENFSLNELDSEVMATVDAAEQAVDELALDLQRGAGNSDAWRIALVDYESAWREVIQGLGERKN